jgi:hypothetical protein
MKSSIFAALFFFLSLSALSVCAEAQSRPRRQVGEPPLLSWDLAGAFGSFSGYSYSEIDVGLNYRFMPPFVWRNVAWDRIASAPVSAQGLDSSVRYELFSSLPDTSVGFRFYAGPGLRIATTNYSGYFGEAGVLLRMGGLNVGLGLKVINYFTPGKDPNTNLTLPSQDTMVLVTLAGGGGF